MQVDQAWEQDLYMLCMHINPTPFRASSIYLHNSSPSYSTIPYRAPVSALDLTGPAA